MTAILNHAAQRPFKTQLFAEVLAEVRATRGHVWSMERRDESLIVGQIDSRAFIVVVKLPGRTVLPRVIEVIADCNRAGGLGFIVHEPGSFERLRVWTGK